MAADPIRLNLARKYRPQNFDTILGQELVVKHLKEAIRLDRIAPAYVFSGPRGTGKTTSARIFARAACCMNKDFEKRPCGECASCMAFEKSQNIDVLEIDGASHTGVDDIRSIIESVAYRPNIGRRKVFIIDEVHMLSNAAFNALLKTLEEPPPHILFLFATTEIEKIPATVLSRTQRMELRRLKVVEIVQNLTKIAKEEQISIAPEIIEQIATAADGGLRDAQTLLDQAILLSAGKTIDAEVVQGFLGTIGVSQELEILEGIARHDVAQSLKKIALFSDQGKDLVSLISRLVHWTRSLLILKSTGSTELIAGEFTSEQLKEAEKNFSAWSIEDLNQLFEVLFQGLDRIRKSDRPRIVLETSLIKASRIVLTEDLSQLIQRMSAAPVSAPSPAPTFAPSATAPQPQPQRAAPARTYSAPTSYAAPTASASTSASGPAETAQDVVNEIKRKRPSLAALVVCAESNALEGDKLLLKFTPGHFALRQLSEKILKKELDELIREVSGSKVKEAILQEVASKSESTGGRNFMTDAKKTMVSDPSVKKAAQLLGAEIESVTVEGVKV